MTVLPIPASLTNQTWTAPAGTYTLPAARTACHGAVTVDLTACVLVDGGGTAGLLTASADSTALTVKGAGGNGTRSDGRGPNPPAVFGWTTTSATTGALVNMTDGITCTVTLNGFTSTGLMKLVVGQGVNPASLIVVRGVHSTSCAVSIEASCSQDVDNSVINGGGPNTNPVGLHWFQIQGASPPATRSLWIPGTYLRCTNSTITGYISSASSGFRQGDSVLVESCCEYVFIDNCNGGGNSDSGMLDSKASWGQVSNSTINSLAGRALSQHCMGNSVGLWNGLRSLNNIINVPNSVIPLSGGFTEAYQAEGILTAIGDTVTLVSGARLAVTAFGDSPGSGAPGSYPRLGSITMYAVTDAAGNQLAGPNVKGDDSTHHTTIAVAGAPAGILYGSSIGPPSVAVVRSAIFPRIWRTYVAGQRDSIPATDTQWLSFKPTTLNRSDLRGVNGGAAQTAIVNTMAAYFAPVADLPNGAALYYHEPDNDGVAGYPGDYVTETGVVIARVMPIVNSGRSHPMRYCTCLTGGPFLGNTAGQWMAPGVNLVGVDSYVNNTQLSKCAQFALVNGFDWAAPEFGYSATTNAPDQATYLAHIQAARAVWEAQPNPPICVLIFNQFQSQFIPLLANGGASDTIQAYWLGLDTGVGANSPVVGSFSGAGSSNSVGFTLPTGLTPGLVAIAKITYSGGAAIVITPPNAGWVPLGARLVNGNVDSSQLYQRTIVAGDSGATVAFGLSATMRWAVAGAVTSGVIPQFGAPITGQDLTPTPNLTMPGWTPLKDGAIALGFLGARDAVAANIDSFSAPTGWLEDADRFTATTSPNVGAYLMHKQLGPGTAGVPQPSSTIVSQGAAYKPLLCGIGPRQFGDLHGRLDAGFGVALINWANLQYAQGAALTTTNTSSTVAAGGVVGNTGSTQLNTATTFNPGNGNLIWIRSEHMLVTAGSGTGVLTVVRGQDGTTPIATIAPGDAVTTPNSWDEINNYRAAGLPYRARFLLGINAPPWAKVLGAVGQPLTICDPNDGTVIYTCPRWWDPAVKAAFDDLCTKIAAQLESDPLCRSIAIHFAETIYGEPTQRGTGSPLVVAATGVNAGKNNAQVFTEAGLNGATATAPDPTDAAALLYPSDLISPGLTRWQSYGFTTTRLYYPGTPVQSWNPVTFGSVTDPGNWTELVLHATLTANMGQQVEIANNSVQVPLAQVGGKYPNMYASMTSTGSPNAFQTAVLSGILSAYQTVGANVATKAADGVHATLTFNTPHGRIVGESVRIQGVDATFNGTVTLTAVTANTASYALAATVTQVASAGWMASTSNAEALRAVCNVLFGITTSSNDPLGLVSSPVTKMRAKSVEMPSGWQTYMTTTDTATYAAAGAANTPTVVGGNAVIGNEMVVVMITPGGGPTDTADTIPLADAMTRGNQAQARSLGDSVPLAAVAARSTSAARSSTDLVPVTEAISRGSQTQGRTTGDSVPLSDVLTRAGSSSRTATDTVPVADVAARGGQAQPRGTADVFPLADVTTGQGNLQQQVQTPVSSIPTSGNSTSPAIVMPVLTGGEMIFLDLVFSNTTAPTITQVPTLPSGAFAQAGTLVKGALTVFTYAKVAVPADSGQTATAVFSVAAKWAATADAYQGAAQQLAAHVYAIAGETTSTNLHTTPTVTITRPGSWVREVVADRGNPSSTSMAQPAGFLSRSQNAGVGGTGSVSVNSADNGAPKAAGAAGGDVWNAQLVQNTAVMVTIGVAPASAGGGNAVAADSIPLADSASRSQGPQGRSLADTAPIADTLVRSALQAARALTDAFPGLADTAARAQTQSRPTADTLPIAELATRSGTTQARGTADSVPLAASLARTQGTQNRTLADTVPIADAVTRNQGHSVSTADTVPLADVATAKSSLVHIISDSIPLAVALTGRTTSQPRPAADDLTVTDLPSRFGVRAARATSDEIILNDFAQGPIVFVPPPLRIRPGTTWAARFPHRGRWSAHT